MKKIVYCLLFFFGMQWSVNAQSGSYSEIYDTLKSNDSLLFDRGFNHCEIQYFKQFIAEDFEFYHDKAGTIESKAAFIKVMQNGICNPDNTTKSRRELVGKLEVFPLYNNGKLYGALQKGIHKFYETTNTIEVEGSIAKFSHLWILEQDTWYLKRVISYDHQ
ncbi:DUF4440 domain-containing protein [Psychroserpens sp. SPM9]|uniref:DUF4440 domain-containing protein n=1 Tax=Psychroserpens sp. SPM9 TaxID=2975598 RepID=UPI0021A354FE|nr:DUF4440 domain-containing protein [Psychroserpens sp. SPM9]MDG5492942.1 DUF4440 domain-containing protein [Psychroserpens sp. SPM9]